MGVAVLIGQELVYYATTSFRADRPVDALIRATRLVLQRLITDYRPNVLAYEQPFFAPSTNSAMLRAQEGEIKRVAHRVGIRVTSYSPTEVRKHLCGDAFATKPIVARILAERYPELRRHLETRNAWQAQYWFHAFDALAVGVMCAEAMDGDAKKNSRQAAA